MNNNMNTLIEHKCVIAIAAQVISHANDDQAQAQAQADIEENKGNQEI
jgi:hypothetical protein